MGRYCTVGPGINSTYVLEYSSTPQHVECAPTYDRMISYLRQDFIFCVCPMTDDGGERAIGENWFYLID